MEVCTNQVHNMKIGTRPQIRFVAVVASLMAVYVPYRMWVNRDITWRWKDEVQLADGARVWIARTEVREILGGGEPFRGPSRTTKSARLELPGGSKPVVWEHRMEPMVVERGLSSVQWIVIATPIWCNEYREFGSPTPPYVQFEYVDGKWRHQAIAPRWYGKPSNLLMNDQQREAHDGGSITAEQIVKMNYIVFKDLLSIEKSAKMNCDREQNYRSKK